MNTDTVKVLTLGYIGGGQMIVSMHTEVAEELALGCNHLNGQAQER